MRFQRLRLSGFKSFVDPTEFRIEPGITGIVGPNGCGKSNLLEALRWVMGANSAKAMRAGGMDDVIFAGSGDRPQRSHAEVTLTIDNAERRAPPAFNDTAIIEVVRRIDRGEGSTYRVNGREVRARDVQLLFADASTGSNSPALVRQGQISELIAARPQNRRMILEEAAGVSGLHTRRHEADLRLRAAEQNLERLDDVARELESQLGKLRREARSAERYRRLSAEIRALQGAVLYARWGEAKVSAERIASEAAAAGRAVEETARQAAHATTQAAAADAALAPLREAAAVATAILHRLAIEKDRLDREAEAQAAETARLVADLGRIDGDRARESQMVEDAEAALSGLAAELEGLEVEVAAAPERAPELEAAVLASDAARAQADAAVEMLAGEAAAEEAGRRAASQRLEDARSRMSRSTRALDQARQERAALTVAPSGEAADAEAEAIAAEVGLAAARSALEVAEEARHAIQEQERATRAAARGADDALSRLTAEARALTNLVAQAKRGGFSPALEAVRPARGFETALAAALGDDLDAALDSAAPAFWRGADAQSPQWPEGVTPLGDAVEAPAALSARLAMTGLVARADGDRLQSALVPGMRLVSKEGDLWRWDGFTARADAPKPAAVRLEQRTRLAELEAEIAAQEPAARALREAVAEATRALASAEEAARAARRAPPAAEQRLAQARAALERFAREAARREAHAASLNDVIARFDVEAAEHAAALADAQAAFEALPAAGDLAQRLAAARAAAGPAREAAAATRAARDAEAREREGRARRLETLRREADDWKRRAAAAAARLESLAASREVARTALSMAEAAPLALEQRRVAHAGELQAAQARQAEAGDALSGAERIRAEADRAARAADARAGEARELRATFAAQAEAAVQRLAETAQQIRETARVEPEELAQSLADQAVAVPVDAGGIESHLYTLERQREAIGAVNLRAEEEAVETATRLAVMEAERADLTSAIARLRQGIDELNSEGRERLLAAFDIINDHFKTLFLALFQGGEAELRLVESDDPLEAGLEIFACPPGKRMAVMSLMSGGEQALTAAALIFAVFLAQPAPICVLDEVDAPLDDANVDRFCNLLDEMRRRTATRFITITHNPVTMSRMDRLFGVTMAERGVSQLVSVDLHQAEALVAH
ncbi:chromosome segregation protein SMC [Phenylobacterium immobile]|uniref:chromosome segregation protein SMC n=1 Tax=Phenylobacterium immobile TaxID=21 RepID=UPI000A8A06C1|nr:chromosome segregation protein SMC [Phenylobacterium immobile]